MSVHGSEYGAHQPSREKYKIVVDTGIGPSGWSFLPLARCIRSTSKMSSWSSSPGGPDVVTFLFLPIGQWQRQKGPCSNKENMTRNKMLELYEVYGLAGSHGKQTKGECSSSNKERAEH